LQRQAYAIVTQPHCGQRWQLPLWCGAWARGRTSWRRSAGGPRSSAFPAPRGLPRHR